jgi:hypothetical protein
MNPGPQNTNVEWTRGGFPIDDYKRFGKQNILLPSSGSKIEPSKKPTEVGSYKSRAEKHRIM